MTSALSRPEGASAPRRAHVPGGPAAAAPLWAVLTFAWINSLGSGVVTTGIYFLTKSAYGYGSTANYGLGLLLGVTYIAGAMVAGPLLRSLQDRSHRFSGRAALFLLMLGAAAVCALPWAARALAPSDSARGGAWAVWVLIGVYSPLTGMLWPLVESFMSGGRRGPELRSAVGLFNMTWSSALVIAFWGMGPVREAYPLQTIAVLGLAHLGSCVLLLWFTPNPGRHEPASPGAEQAPSEQAHYRDLLTVFRLALPASYMVNTALGPYLPGALDRLEVGRAWQTPLTASWLLARVLTFWVLQRWHGWHGRWSMPVLGGAVMLAGFGGTVLAPLLAGESGAGGIGGLGAPAARVVLILSLALFGIGMGSIYAGALYYAMAVGHSEVEAGGTHEALIGVGYLVGPLCGLATAAAVRTELIPEKRFGLAVVLLVGLASGLVALVALGKVMRRGAGVRGRRAAS
ncbi:MAG TPA: hypothetical protein VD963_08730 [Phycisphaerales bacterium]|nr:hypothetical protein [Phycisphaerales bacterium]